VLRQSPEKAGLRANLWDGKTLLAYLQRRYGMKLGAATVPTAVTHPWLSVAQTSLEDRAGRP
jgi:hypothetical protein